MKLFKKIIKFIKKCCRAIINSIVFGTTRTITKTFYKVVGLK